MQLPRQKLLNCTTNFFLFSPTPSFCKYEEIPRWKKSYIKQRGHRWNKYKFCRVRKIIFWKLKEVRKLFYKVYEAKRRLCRKINRIWVKKKRVFHFKVTDLSNSYGDDINITVLLYIIYINTNIDTYKH